MINNVNFWAAIIIFLGGIGFTFLILRDHFKEPLISMISPAPYLFLIWLVCLLAIAVNLPFILPFVQ